MVPVKTFELAVGHRVVTEKWRGVVTRKHPAEGGGYHLFFRLDDGSVTEGTCPSETVWNVELTT